MWPVSAAPVICPRCKEPFGCEVASGDCWCGRIEIDPATRAAFAQYYDGCLCSECLHTLEAARPAVPSVRTFLAAQLRRRRRRR